VPVSAAKKCSFSPKQLLLHTVAIEKINHRRGLIDFLCNSPATIYTPIGGSALLAIFIPCSDNLEYGVAVRYLLALPFIGLLWLPFYNKELPSLFGFPFFYWYQFAWVPLTALIIWVVYQSDKKKGVE
jgi:hypothetical protein